VISSVGRLARWAAPSVVAACAGAVVAGLVEGAGMPDLLGLAASVGFFALIMLPVLLVGSLGARGLVLAWQPRDLGLTEPDGSSPRLAGWMAVIWLGTLLLAWAIYEGTWMLARTTEFRPLGVGFAEPVIAVTTAFVLFALSRPGARLFAELARRGDARWRRSGRTTLLRPRVIVIAAAGSGVIVAGLLWWLVMKPRLGPIDTSVFHAPALALGTTVAVHVAWSRIPRRGLGGSAFVALGIATIVTAFATRTTRPSLTLEIWGDQPLAGLAIDTLFDLEDIRADISLAEFRPIDRPGAAHPDIILVTIDTVRADHTPPYGGSADMPVLRELGERGSVFTWAFAPSNVTRRSIPAMVIGLEPNRIRGRVVGWALRVDPRHVLLAERLRAGGYETAGFMSLPNFFGLESRTGMQRGLEHLEIERSGAQLSRMASTWLRAREHRADRRPVFLWMHILEPHNWAGGSGTHRTEDERRSLYDKTLAASDSMLGEVLGPFADRAPADAPIVIVTADHGEALGEHGHDYHSTDLYNSQLRVPLVMAGPGIRTQAVPEAVSLVDLVPTIVELAGFQSPPRLDGRSLAGISTGNQPSLPETGAAFAAMIKDRSNPGGVTAFIKGRWKIIDSEDGAVELYDIYSDPGERDNLANERPEILQELKLLIEAKQAAGRVSPFD
jgi:arylsulfatase A-like enzyme